MNDPGGSSGRSAKDDDVLGNVQSTLSSSLSSSSGRRLENDVAQLYMNESLRYQEDVNLKEFSLFAGADGLAASGRHRHKHQNHHQHQQQKQKDQQYEDRPSRIPRPSVAGSRRSSLATTSSDTSKPSPALHLTAPASFLSSSKQPPVTSSAVKELPLQPSHAQHVQTISVSQVTKNSAAKQPGPETTAAEAAFGKPSKSRQQRSTSTWETRQTLADLWTEFQKPNSFSTS